MKMQPASVTQPPGFMLLHGIGMVPSMPLSIGIMVFAAPLAMTGAALPAGEHEQRGEDLAKQAQRHPHLIRPEPASIQAGPEREGLRV